MEKEEPTVTLAPVAVSHPHLAAFTEFLEEFNKETERGAALSATAFIDSLLERTLFAFLIPNDSGLALTKGFNAPLGTFANCPSSGNLRLIRHFEKRGSGSSGLEFKRPAADAASDGLRWWQV